MHAQYAPVSNQTQFSSLPDGVTLMQASFTDHAFERHSHDCFALGMTTYGVQRFRCKGKQYASQVGDFVLFNPDEDHDGSRGTPDGFRYTIWYLPESFVDTCKDLDAGLAGKPYFQAPHTTDRRLASVFVRLSQSLLTTPSESLRAETMMRTFVGQMLSRHGERPVPAAAFRQPNTAHLGWVKDYIQANFQRDLTVAELADIAGLSRAHFTRAFTAAFHSPPHVYLNTVRIMQAQTFMRLGMPLATVAVECGFADQSHFNRRFKGSVGASPAGWLQMTGRTSLA